MRSQTMAEAIRSDPPTLQVGKAHQIQSNNGRGARPEVLPLL